MLGLSKAGTQIYLHMQANPKDYLKKKGIQNKVMNSTIAYNKNRYSNSNINNNSSNNNSSNIVIHQ